MSDEPARVSNIENILKEKEDIPTSAKSKIYKQFFEMLEQYPELKIMFYALLGGALGAKIVFKYSEGFGSIRKKQDKQQNTNCEQQLKTKDLEMGIQSLEKGIQNLENIMMKEFKNIQLQTDAKIESLVAMIMKEIANNQAKLNSKLDEKVEKVDAKIEKVDPKIEKAVADMRAGISVQLEKAKLEQQQQLQAHQKEMDRKLEHFISKVGKQNTIPIPAFKQASFFPSSGMATRFVRSFINNAKKLIK